MAQAAVFSETSWRLDLTGLLNVLKLQLQHLLTSINKAIKHLSFPCDRFTYANSVGRMVI